MSQARQLNQPHATHKNCDRCGLFLPMRKFQQHNLSLDGHMDTCQKCRRWLAKLRRGGPK